MGDAPTNNPPAANAAAQVCAGCGYSLAGLELPGACPGCAGPIPSPTMENLAATVGRGASWVMLGIALAKVATLVTQVVLGWALTDVDFGVFAAASSIGWAVGILKDAGTNAILIQRGAKDYERIAGPLFWMNVTLSGLCALLIVGVGLILSLWPTRAALSPILYIIAASTPLQAVGGQLLTKLRQDLRFAKFSQIQLVSAVLRQVATIVLALAGFKAMSFAWPYILCALYEAFASYRATSEKVWKRSPDMAAWGKFFRQGSWTLAGSGANFALDQGPYFVLGWMVSQEIAGRFWFAFQLTAQTGVLLSYAVQQVLIPALAQLNDHMERQAQAALRALRLMTYVGAIVCVGLSVCIEPLESLVWRGHKAETVPAIVILGFFFSWRIHFGLTTAILHAQGRFKRHAALTAFEGLGLMVVTTHAATRWDADATSISWWIGGWLMFGRLVVTLQVFRDLRVSAVRTLEAMFSGWLLAVFSGGVVMVMDHWLHLPTRLMDASRSVLWRVGVVSPKPWMVDTPANLVRVGILGSTCLLVFLVLTRSLARGHLADALPMVPARLRGPVSRLLGVRPDRPE